MDSETMNTPALLRCVKSYKVSDNGLFEVEEGCIYFGEVYNAQFALIMFREFGVLFPSECFEPTAPFIRTDWNEDKCKLEFVPEPLSEQEKKSVVDRPSNFPTLCPSADYENPSPPLPVPEPLEVKMPEYVGAQPHRFNTCYGMDDLAVQFDRALQKVEAENAELRKTIEFMRSRLSFYLD